MIKVLVISIILFFSTFYGYAQNNLDSLMTQHVPNCEDIAYNATNLIIKYSNKQNYDSVKIVLNYWQAKCGNSEPIIRIKILLAIKEKSFSEQIYDTTILDYVFNYMYRMETEEPEKSEKSYNYYKIYFDYVPIKGDYDNFTQKIAEELLPLQPENSIEQLYCKFYANVLINPMNEIQNTNHYDSSKIKTYYNKKVSKYINKPDFHYNILTGIWIPTGNAKLLGNHPLIGFQCGAKYKKTTFNLTIYFKFLKSKNDYQLIPNGSLDTSSHFFGGYIGADVEREIFKLKRNQFDLLGGIAWDGFDAINTDTKDNNPNNDKGHSINSINLNLGLGYKYNFSKKGYIALQGKYNFINYKNLGGTDMSGNAITIIFLVGGFTNTIKDYELKTLRYND